MERIIVFLQNICPDSLQLDQSIRQLLTESRESFHRNARGDTIESESSPLAATMMFWWQIFMTSVLTMFFLSLISHFAQYYQVTLDQEDSNILRRRLPHNVRCKIISPISGRLRLPLPTPMTKRKKKLETATTDFVVQNDDNNNKQQDQDISLSTVDNSITSKKLVFGSPTK
jgi:hypothetical protein